MRLAAGSRQRLRLERQHRQVVAHAPRPLLDDEPLLEHGILRRDADWTAPGVAMMAITWCGTERVVVRLVDRSVAVDGDERRGADRDGVGAHRQRLGDVCARADAARDHELHLAVHVELQKRFDGLAKRRQGRNAGMLDEDVLGGAGAALHAVEDDNIGSRYDRQGDIVFRSRRTDLDVNGLLPIGDLAQLLNLDLEVIRAGPVGMAACAPLVDPGRQRPHPGDALGDFLAEQHAAAAGLRALADNDLDGVAAAHVLGIDAVARRQYLVDEERRGGALLPAHAAVAGRRARAHHAGTLAERLLRMTRHGTGGHTGDRDRNLELDWFFGKARAEHDIGGAALAVTLERIARDRGAEKGAIVEARRLTIGAEAADLVDPFIGSALDFVNNGGGGRGRARAGGGGRTPPHFSGG